VDLATFISANEIIHVRLNDLPRHHLWTQFVRHLGLGALNVERGLVFDTAMLAVEYALGGDGIVLVDINLFNEHVRTGRLVRPFDLVFDEGYGYYLLTQPEALSDPAIASFRSWLIERLTNVSPET
jgi:DNA-binding transcriptional LysR family regulator